jgi:hypothetical protein
LALLTAKAARTYDNQTAAMEMHRGTQWLKNRPPRQQTGSISDDIVAKLKLRMINHALPLWSKEGWDRTTGGFVERLDQEGRADRLAPRRVRVQARQIYCFAKAAQMGWYPDGREIALKRT